MGCTFCHDLEQIPYFTRSRTSFFSLMFFYFPFSYQWWWWKPLGFFFFSDAVTCGGHFAMARCKATTHGHAFVPFPGAAPLLHLGQLCLWRTVGIKLASAERCDLWRDYGETHPQKKPNPDLSVAGYGKRPVPGSPCYPALGHCRWGWAEKVPRWGCCLLPRCGLPAPQGWSRGPSEVTGRGQQMSTEGRKQATALCGT